MSKQKYCTRCISKQKYCTRCGRKLKEIPFLDHYNSITGKPVYHTKVKCPVNPIVRFLASHTSYELDEYNQPIYTCPY